MPQNERLSIRDSVKKHLKDIRSCYEAGLLKNPESKGKVILQWTIADGGVVKEADVQHTTLKNPEIEECMVASVKTWKFPSPPKNQEAQVTYPFLLKPSE